MILYAHYLVRLFLWKVKHKRRWNRVIKIVGAATITASLITLSMAGYQWWLSIPHPPTLKATTDGSPYLYEASGKVFEAKIGKKQSNEPQVEFSVNGSKIAFTPNHKNGRLQKPIKEKNKLTFSNVYPNIDFTYQVIARGVKEEIVINRPSKQEEFPFLLEFAGAQPGYVTENIAGLAFYDDEGNYLFHFEKPFAFDSTGSRTEKAQLLIKKDSASGQYFAVVGIDPDWLASPSRVYPVYIDPSIVHDTSSEFATGTSNRIQDTGSGASPNLDLPWHELTTDIHTAALYHLNNDWNDSSGNANNLTAAGNAAFTTSSKLGSHAGTFDSSGDYASVASNATLNFGTGDFTVEAWVKTTSTELAETIVIKRTTAINAMWYMAMGPDGVGKVRWFTRNSGGTAVNVASNRTINDGSWHHVAGVRDAGSVKIYIDGVLDNTASGAAVNTDNTESLVIGEDIANGAATSWGGQIDEVRISNIARSPEEIRQDAQRFPYGVHTSDTIDLGTSVVSLDSLQWTELGVQTGDGETVYSSTNLVSQWNLNETSGTTAANNAGAGSCGGVPANCNGTLTGFSNTTGQDVAPSSGWTAVNRKWGAGALMFDGSNDYVTISDNSALDITEAITVEAWVSGTASVDKHLVGKYTTTGNQRSYRLYLNAGKAAFIVSHNGADTSVTSVTDSAALPSGWHHIAGTYDRTNAKIYVDGVLKATTAGTSAIFAGTSALEIGGSADFGQYFLGILDSPRIYSRALGASEILSNYQAGNIEFQTRTGSTSSPPSGWEEWRPVTAETSILSMNADSANWSTSNSNLLTKANESTIKVEGTGSLKSTVGAPQVDASTTGLWHMEETSGTGAYIKDSTANANHGTPTGTTVIDGFYGKARNFNGSSDEISIPAGSIPTGNQITISFWSYGDTSLPVNNSIILATSADSIRTVNVHLPWSDGNIYWDAGNNGSTYDRINKAASASDFEGRWTFWAFTKNATTGIMRIYLDGAEWHNGTGKTMTFPTSTVARIGSSAGTNYYPGKIDEVKIDNVERSAEEVAEAYRAGRDHRLSRTITAADLSAKTKIPFFVAADRPGTLVETYAGETDHSIYGVDTNTAGLWHLEEHAGSGAYIKDSSSNNNHGTPTGTTFVQGKLGKGRSFGGSSDDVDVGSSSNLNFIAARSISLWVKPNSACLSPTQGCGILGNASWSGSGGKGYHMGFYSDGNFAFLIEEPGGGGSVSVPITTYFKAETWTYVAVTFNGSQLRMYVDGGLAAGPSSTGPTTGATYTLKFGRDQQGGWSSPEFAGSLDEIHISTSERTAEEIRLAYQYGLRTHQINVDYVTTAGTDGPTSTSDTQFTPDTTTGLYKGDTVIVREKVDATTYMMQGEVTSISAGLVTVASWTGTAPSGGYSTNADVFKWQREYWDVTDILAADRNALVRLGLRVLDASEGFDMYLDDFRSNTNYLTTPSGSTITSTAQRYFQYRAIFSSSDTQVSPSVTSVTLNYTTNNTPTAPTALWAEGQTNPTGVTDTTPEFSAVYNDPDVGDIANYYQVIVNTASDFSGTEMWNSGQTSMANCTAGNRCQDISYAGTALSLDGSTFYWQIRYWDDDGAVSPYSAVAQFTMANLVAPTSCSLEEAGDDSQITINWADPNSIETGYGVDRSVNGGAFGNLTTTGANETSYDDTGVSQGNTYQYRIRAVESTGPSYSAYCTTATLSLQSGTFQFKGVNLKGLTIQ